MTQPRNYCHDQASEITNILSIDICVWWDDYDDLLSLCGSEQGCWCVCVKSPAFIFERPTRQPRINGWGRSTAVPRGLLPALDEQRYD